MNAKEEYNEEQATIKVTDKRKFNLDGSVREGVTIEPEKPKEEVKTETKEPEISQVIDQALEIPESAETPEESDEMFDDEEIPGADEPASFVNFLSTLATNAAASLGAMPHPVTGQRTVDLETGKYWLDVLGMLKEKLKTISTRKNRAFWKVFSAICECSMSNSFARPKKKLKQQAAQKFSASDILGRK